MGPMARSESSATLGLTDSAIWVDGSPNVYGQGGLPTTKNVAIRAGGLGLSQGGNNGCADKGKAFPLHPGRARLAVLESCQISSCNGLAAAGIS